MPSKEPMNISLRPASPDEAGLFYALPPEKDGELGAIGHVRMDFGREGDEFWHTWWPRGPEGLNTPEFKEELGQVIDQLRRGVLKDLGSMRRFCREMGGEIVGGALSQNYGYVVETDHYIYRLRCNPTPADYQAYLACFDKRAQRMELAEQPPVGRVIFASGERLEFTDPEEYLQTVNDKFFPELARRLKREGISTGPVEMERLPVLLDGQEVMSVAPGGTIFLQAETADSQPVMDAYDVVAGVTAQVHEYTEAMMSAPPLKAMGLHDGFRLLADFNGVVLAGQELEDNRGYQFVTWVRSPDRTAVAHGHYYDGGNTYEAAKLDFACRAGLVDEHRQFTDEQLAEVYRCVSETLDSEYPITQEREKTLTAVMGQIEGSVENLDELVGQSNQRELEAAERQTGIGPEMGMAP